MMEGKIVGLKMDKGFGFISVPDQSEDYFFHRSALQNVEFEELKIGFKVSFQETEGRNGPRAEDVEIL